MLGGENKQTKKHNFIAWIWFCKAETKSNEAEYVLLSVQLLKQLHILNFNFIQPAQVDLNNSYLMRTSVHK